MINRCYGGFCLSEKACRKLINDHGWTVDTWDDGDYPDADLVDNSNDDIYQQYPDAKTTHRYYVNSDRHPQKELRTNADVIQVVEELGDEASGYCAQLEIVELPDDVDWHITEYDGVETIREDHRTWPQ